MSGSNGTGVSTAHYRVLVAPGSRGHVHVDVYDRDRPYDVPLISDTLDPGNARQRAKTLKELEHPDEVERVLKVRAVAKHERARRTARRTSSAKPDEPSRLTDVANGERLVARHGADLRYCHQTREWFVYDGQRWAPDSSGELARRAKETARSIYIEAAAVDDLLESQALAKHAMASERSSRITAMIELAQSEPGVSVASAAFDADPWLLNVANGTIDLRTGKLRTHDRGDLMSKLAPVAYDPTNTRCDRWEKFVERIMGGDGELTGFLQRAIGYSLTGVTDEQCLLFLYGSGNNGKTKLLETLRLLLGDYAIQADFTTFLERKSDGPRNDVARLCGARLVTSSEVGEGKRLNESLVKTLTGSDVIAARKLFQESFEFTPAFKLWLAANHKPEIRGTDVGMWRRIRLVPFTVQIPEAERDEQLLDKLRAELPGILSWAVAGCLLWQRDHLMVPSVVQQATSEYRTEMDRVGAFLEECCEFAPTYIVRCRPLYLAYRRHSENAGEFPLSETKFGERLTERGIQREKTEGGKVRVGLRLAPEFAHLADPAPLHTSARFSAISTNSSPHEETLPEKHADHAGCAGTPRSQQEAFTL